jgi:tetratricopeptide (TPR) repeat protein
MRIRVQLIDVTTDKTLWAESFDRDLEDIFLVQKEIAQSIFESMRAELTNDEIIQLDQQPTQSFSAYDIYLMGRDKYYRYDSQSNQAAILEFKKALQIDPKFALAWAGLGDAYSQNYGRFQMEKFWIDSSLMASQRAIEIDSNFSDGYKALAMGYNYEGDYEKSIAYNQKALALNPNNAQAMGNLGSCYLITGNLEEALKWQKKAAGLNPKSFIPYQLVGWIYRLQGDYENAQKWLIRSLEIRPFRDTYEHLAYTYISQNEPEKAQALIPKIIYLAENEKSYETAGLISFFCRDFEKAETFFNKSADLNPKLGTDIRAVSPLYLGFLNKFKGDYLGSNVLLGGALHLFGGEKEENTQDPEVYFNLAAIYAILGKNEESIHYLKVAKEKNWVDIFMATQNPIFEDLKKHREFQKVINQISAEINLTKNSEIFVQ